MWRPAAILILVLRLTTSIQIVKLNESDLVSGYYYGVFCLGYREDSSEVEEQTVNIALLWNNILEYAAAEVLRATLAGAGYNSRLIQLYRRGTEVQSAESTHILSVEVPAGNLLQLQIQHTLFGGWRRRSDECDAAVSGLLNDTDLEDTTITRDCDFIIPETNNFTYATLYLVEDETCVAKQIKRSNLASLQACFEEEDKLTDMLRNSNSSLFLLNFSFTMTLSLSQVACVTDNYYLQNNNKQSNYVTALNTTEFIFNKTVSLKYGDGNNVGEVVPDEFIKFSPELWLLTTILARYRLSNDGTADICYQISNYKKIQEWQNSIMLDRFRYRVLVIICSSEAKNLNEYLYMMKALSDYRDIDDSTLFGKENTVIQTIFIDCSDISWLTLKIIQWRNSNTLFYGVGVVLPNEIAVATTTLTRKYGIVLLTYDLYMGSYNPLIGSSTGKLEHLILALRRLLANCGWQRVAIISEPTQLAEAVSRALRASAGLPSAPPLKIKDLTINSSSAIPGVLRELLNVDARVLLVNCEAATTAAVLAAAQELGMTRDRGFVWIVREYHAADNATTVTRPYSVSFWWRGERQNDSTNDHDYASKLSYDGKITKGTELRLKLEDTWRGRAWPLHAAPILDALFTLIYLNNLIHRDKWGRINRASIIPGIIQSMKYEENAQKSPLLFVQQWGSEPRPRVLATWRGGDWREEAEACPAPDPPPGDGSTHCLIPLGDAFRPSCQDSVWIPFIVFSTVFLVAGIIYCSRKAYLALKYRINTEYAKRILTRRERVFEALVEHLLDRNNVDLFQELGSGRFGRVHQGILREPGTRSRNVIVACKALREDASSAEESDFLREAHTLASLNHKHIIRFVGICIVDGPPLLLMEHAYFGDLQHYLQERRYLLEAQTSSEGTDQVNTDEKAHVSAKAITKLAQEATMALAYLAELEIVHRDLRAANCLLDGQRSLKLADFGLARAIGSIDGEYLMCRRGMVPVLWMAPESLAQGVFSPASDVWSFGVLVFELVTLGCRPYGVQPPPLVLRHVVGGGHPLLPWDASARTRALARACWRREPDARPTAAHLVTWLVAHPQALRPTLAKELVDIDELMKGQDFDGPELLPPDILPTGITTLQSLQASNQ